VVNNYKRTIQEINLTEATEDNFNKRFVGAIILTHGNKFLLQKIVDARPFFPAGSLTTFGGKIEKNEAPISALIRELNEELGAKVNSEEAIYLGAITEEATGHTELIHAYFWHDKLDTITGCYEDEAQCFNYVQDILRNSNVTDDVKWMLGKCSNENLIGKQT